MVSSVKHKVDLDEVILKQGRCINVTILYLKCTEPNLEVDVSMSVSPFQKFYVSSVKHKVDLVEVNRTRQMK